MCRSRGDLLVARFDVMQHLARLVGGQEADRQLHQLWGNDAHIQQMQLRRQPRKSPGKQVKPKSTGL